MEMICEESQRNIVRKRIPVKETFSKKEGLLPVISFDWFGERCEKVAK